MTAPEAIAKHVPSDMRAWMTDEQWDSLNDVVQYQGPEKLQAVQVVLFQNVVMAVFDHITIGIEKDGHAHS